MFFSKKPKKAEVRHVVYMNKLAKYRQLILHLEEVKSGKLYYFFDETRDELSQLLLAKRLSDFEFSQAQDIGSTSDKLALVLEAHPLTSITETFLQKFSPDAQIEFWLGLDESIMKMFGSERIITLMEKMGMKEEERIEHSMIVKSIEKAQKKLESMISNHQDIRSSIIDWEQTNNVPLDHA